MKIKQILLLLFLYTLTLPGNAQSGSEASSIFSLQSQFATPPPGYGQVPFWWWTGDPLEKERLLWQIEELHKKGVTGMQVNYAHEDTQGWPTYKMEPELFSEAWWEIWKFVADECGKRNMGIGLSGYTIDWPKTDNLFNKLIYSDPELNGRAIVADTILHLEAGQAADLAVDPDAIGIWAYPVKDSLPQAGGMDLKAFVHENQLRWTPQVGYWQVWVFTAGRIAGTLNPIHPLAGQTVVEKFFQPFQNRAVNQSAEGLNYFFQDEVHFGVGDVIWCDDFNDEFIRRKGYDVLETLPALFTDMGQITPKARLDFLDVKVSLSEERYFIPIFNWHNSRGLIYGADPMGRGLNPGEYGDNFRIQRWYTAPGHDTPGGNADLIKGKVSSSIANLYNRPRVWLEGYHSLGWGATPERLMYATSENYLYGCNLLNLHGLYYTTHGSYWEWAPPDYHFRMPYWEHMDVFMKYFERLSWLLSQGTLQAPIAILYPVSPVQARIDGQAATDTAFQAGRKLFQAGYDFVFMDDQSLERAVIQADQLEVSDMQFKVLILPNMKAIRWSTLQKALAFSRAGGTVINIGALPEASDRAGSHDPELDQVIDEIFGAQGKGIAVNAVEELYAWIESNYSPAVSRDQPVRSLHRTIGQNEVFYVMDAPKDSWCTFQTKGEPEWWDPWTGTVKTVEWRSTDRGVEVRMPLDSAQGQVIVFKKDLRPKTEDPNQSEELRNKTEVFSLQSNTEYRVPNTGNRLPETRYRIPYTGSLLLNGAWEFELVPTMNNHWGDFRLPVTEDTIGAEARIFRYEEGEADDLHWTMPEFDDSTWKEVTYGFGQKFWKLGPIPAHPKKKSWEKKISRQKAIDPKVPLKIKGKEYFWEPYNFSWRFGIEGDPGHQGWHGLKEQVTDQFIGLGKQAWGHNEILYQPEEAGERYYLFTTVSGTPGAALEADTSGSNLETVWFNGQVIGNLKAEFRLKEGINPILLKYKSAGRGHFVLLDQEADQGTGETPLSMTWFDRKNKLMFDVKGGEIQAIGRYRFTAPPGLKRMDLTVQGVPEIWVDGQQVHPVLINQNSPQQYQVILDQAIPNLSVVAIQVRQSKGYYGGSVFPEPIRISCETGLIEIGDWSVGSVLQTYSGGARYRKTFQLNDNEAQQPTMLDLGVIVATAEIRINGEKAGILVAPPWQMDITTYLKPGENQIEILVFNTLANHYFTIPTRYKGATLKSGLIGPVLLKFQKP